MMPTTESKSQQRRQAPKVGRCANFSTPTYSRSEHVGIEPIVISELKLRHVERHIFGAHLMERADYAAFEDRPKTFNRIRVHSTDDVLMFVMIDHAVRKLAEIIAIAGPRVGREQANFVGNGLVHKVEYVLRRYAIQHARDNVALALHRADDRRLVVPTFLFIPMPVRVFAANISFIKFDNAAKFFQRLHQCATDFVAHAMRGLVATETHLPLNLQRTNSLFAGQHQVHNFEPLAERLVGILENRARDNGKAIARVAAWSALRALPVPLAGLQVIDFGIAATRAVNAVRPAPGLQISLARILVTKWETRLKFAFGHLMDWFRTFCHGGYPCTSTVGAYCHG